MTVQCCVCSKIRIQDEWKAAEQVEGVVSHTYCPVCFEAAKEEIDRFRMARSAERERHTLGTGCYRRIRIRLEL